MQLKKELLFDALSFIFGILAISFLYPNNGLLTIILFLLWFLGLKYWHKSHDLCFFVAGAIIGPLSEITAIFFGAWAYTNPTFLGIPIWLPLGWGWGVVFIKRVAEIFVKVELRNNKKYKFLKNL